MAIGIGRMLGFQFRENFHYPYTSLSVREFWRRWHISLSSWFREYVYIPLGGSRGTLFATCRNLFIVFLLTGIWHGANFTFWAWGLYYAVLMLLERLFLGKLLDRNPVKPLNWIYTIFAVMVGWVFFRSDSIAVAVEYIRQLFNFDAVEYSILSFLSMKVLLVLAAAAQIVTHICRKAIFKHALGCALPPLLSLLSFLSGFLLLQPELRTIHCAAVRAYEHFKFSRLTLPTVIFSQKP